MQSLLNIDRAARLLVVDDDETFLLMIRKVMEKTGIVVLTCTNGEDALDVYEDVNPDMVLLDIHLPNTNGIEVCRKLRATSNDSTLPILLMTSGSDRNSIDQGFEAGATDFILKPIDWSLFPHRVEYLVSTSRAMNELETNRAPLQPPNAWQESAASPTTSSPTNLTGRTNSIRSWTSTPNDNARMPISSRA